jgi:hypothetical protein
VEEKARSDPLTQEREVDRRNGIEESESTPIDTDFVVVAYYESMKRDLKTRPIYDCRDDERLKN